MTIVQPGRRIAAAFALVLALCGGPSAADDLARWKAQAAQVRIVRDDWGVAHVHGKTDAQAVFGMVYAQAEDDFNRVETNYIVNLGRLAEAEGEAAIWQDLRQKLYYDPSDLKAKYATSPAWLKALMNAWADGLNYYLATHPQVKPRVITRFEPWMALAFSEGSIGGDIERISLPELEAFYGGGRTSYLPRAAADGPPPAIAAAMGEVEFKEPGGSNGIAISPSITRDGHALLLINPHTSFFFRSELQMTSDEGLNAYGAVTWGQFFVYQGFNAHQGWMHTSSGVDVVDEFAETIVKKGGKAFYRYGAEERPVTQSQVVVPYRAADGSMKARTFTVFRTHHGPIVRAAGDKWIAFAMMFKPGEALQQSFLRTKSTDLVAFQKVADQFKANSSNDTLYADDKGAAAYLHPQFIPIRDDRFDFARPVDGSDPATDWKGMTPLAGQPQVISPTNGWVYNSNDSPWNAAGPGSLKREAFPRYMDAAGSNARTAHALRVLTGAAGLTREGLLAKAYDPFLPFFDRMVPKLVADFEALPTADPLRLTMAGQVSALKDWDRCWSAASQETSLAVFWGEALWAKAAPAAKAVGMNTWDYIYDRTTPAERIDALVEASDRLAADFGSWRTPWGEINRFQRLTPDIVQTFHDDQPSLPVPFTSAQWGSLASFGAKRYPGTKRYYGTSGNSFVAVVEFGPRVRALAVTAGGESGDPASKHFNDQAARYAAGDLREVYFYPDQLVEHTERTYRPGM